jgi:hypothetical protein
MSQGYNYSRNRQVGYRDSIAAIERANIVAWLREQAGLLAMSQNSTAPDYYRHIADAIEQGEHVPARGPPR